MLNIRLICVGKLKERFYLEACREYEKRLGTLCRMEILQLEEEPDRPGALAKEAERIRAAIPQGSCVVAMCIEGFPPRGWRKSCSSCRIRAFPVCAC